MFDPHQVPLEEVASCFEANSYALVLSQRESCSISVEEALIVSLINIEPRLLEGVPVLLARNEIDYERLRVLIERHGLWNEFGYLGNFSLRHVKNKHLRDLVRYCHTKLRPSVNISGVGGDFFKEARDNREKYWRVVGAPSYSALEKQFRRYVHD